MKIFISMFVINKFICFLFFYRIIRERVGEEQDAIFLFINDSAIKCIDALKKCTENILIKKEKNF